MDINKFIESLRTRDSIPEVFKEIATALPDRTAYSEPVINADGSRTWFEHNYRGVASKVYRLANYLIAHGVKPGDRVAIISYTRPEWMIADLAILFAGATSVAVYQSVSAHEVGYILFDSTTTFVFAENEEQVKKLYSLMEKPFAVPENEDRPALHAELSLRKIVTFEELESDPKITLLKDILSNEQYSIDAPSINKSNDVASLVYTSGTTGPPKGVIQTHRNHLANVWQASKTEIFAPTGDIFLFLPLAHSFAKLIGNIGFLTPTVIKFPAVTDRKKSVLNAQSVLRDLKEGSAEVAPIVPRILEKMMAGVIERSKQQSTAGKLVGIAVNSRLKAFELKRRKEPLPLSLRLKILLTGFVAKKVKTKLFGPRFKHVVSGGARLPLEVNEFFTAIGVTIYEGYGLTETCVATNVNRIGKAKIGSVGPCMHDLEMKIAEDGEILFRGPNVTRGYLNRPTATKAQWDADGWFHTGDLGEIDADGDLSITGRKKDLIVTAGGKKIAPQGIEEKFVTSPLVSTAVMVGDGKPFCAVLIAPERAAVLHWAKEKGINLPAKLSESKELQSEFEALVEQINSTLSKFETVKKVKIIDDELTVENGLLTPTFKVKRAVVTKKFAQVIEGFYS